MIELKLRKSAKVALIDERDAHQGGHVWSWHDYLGVVRYDNDNYDADQRRTPHLLLHREIAGAEGKQYVVHVNSDRLDNRRQNLLLLSHAAYTQYVHKPRGKSEYRGIKVTKTSFQAYCGGFIGTFYDEEEAARAYDEAAWQRFGASAKVNFPKAWQVCEECFKAHFVGQECKCQEMTNE